MSELWRSGDHWDEGEIMIRAIGWLPGAYAFFKFTDNQPEALHDSWSTPPEGESWPRLGSCFAPDESTA